MTKKLACDCLEPSSNIYHSTVKDLIRLLRYKVWIGSTLQLKAIGVSSELEVSIQTKLLGLLPLKTILKADSEIFQAVLRHREDRKYVDYEHHVTPHKLYFGTPPPLPAWKPWFAMTITVYRKGEATISCDYTNEPHPLGRKLSEDSLTMDLLEFPRPLAELEPWYLEGIGCKEVEV